MLVLAITTSSMQFGCSFLLANGPPSADAMTVVALDGSVCSNRNTLPVMDVVLASASGGLFVLSGIGTPPSNETTQQRQDREQRGKIVAISALVVGGVAAASAVWGFHTTHKCRQYIEANAEKKAEIANPELSLTEKWETTSPVPPNKPLQTVAFGARR
jgi:hypothetical protein